MSSCASEPAPAEVAPNMIVAEKYRLTRHLGSGGMGTVWLAEHKVLGHRVAIKLLHRTMNQKDTRVRFDREAKLSAKLGELSRHITRVLDYGVLDSGTPFIVLEYLQGESLAELLLREKKLPLQQAARITEQLCRGLTAAHGAGVVHRDLKPPNVYLVHTDTDPEPIAKLLDFGIAKNTFETSESLSTAIGTILGTPGYISPEQLEADGQIDHRADLFAVAAMVYRMITGRAPFGSGSVAEIATRVLTHDPKPPTLHDPELPPAIDAWMARGLSKQPERRFASAAELATELAAVAAQPSVVRPAPRALLTTQSDPAPFATTRLEAPTFRRALPKSLFLVACGVALAGAFALTLTGEVRTLERSTLARAAGSVPAIAASARAQRARELAAPASTARQAAPPAVSSVTGSPKPPSLRHAPAGTGTEPRARTPKPSGAARRNVSAKPAAAVVKDSRAQWNSLNEL